MRLLAVLISTVALTGCATMFGNSTVKPVGRDSDLTALVQPANVRSAYVLTQPQGTVTETTTVNGVASTRSTMLSAPRTVVCAEPPPDAALQALAEAAATLKDATGNEAGVNGKLQTTMVELAGRTQTVLVARDLLTNLCILRMNGFLTDDQVSAGYLKVTDVISTLAQAAKSDAEASASRARTQEVQAGLSPAANPAVESVSTAANKFATRFSGADGKVLSTDLTTFTARADVKTLIGKGGADRLLAAKTKADLVATLMTDLQDEAVALTALAEK